MLDLYQLVWMELNESYSSQLFSSLGAATEANSIPLVWGRNGFVPTRLRLARKLSQAQLETKLYDIHDVYDS